MGSNMTMFVVAVVVVVIAVIVVIVGVRKYRGGNDRDGQPIGGNASATAFTNPMYEEGNSAAVNGGDDTGYMDVGAAH